MKYMLLKIRLESQGVNKMAEPRLTKLRMDKHIKEPIQKVFLCDFLKTVGKDKEDDIYLSIKDIIRVWGYEKFYDEMVDNLHRKIKNNPDENVCVTYDYGALDSDKSHQKLLEWSIYDEREKKFGLIGGVLFHNDEMSFHT